MRAKKTTPLQTVVWAETASKQGRHRERMEWIEKNVPENYRALVRDHMVGFIAAHVYSLPTKEKRREYIDDIPLDCDPPWARSLVENYVLSLWKNQRKLAA